MNGSIDRNRKSLRTWTIITGITLGTVAVILYRLGNPPNMGVCAACSVRDVTGGLGLFSGPAGLQYLRPEVPGFILGSFAAALMFREFKSRGGSSPILRFLLGAFLMIGAMVFMGCPIRLMVRLGGGDYASGLMGLLGILAGAGAASLCIRRGFTLGAGRDQARLAGYVMPLFGIGLVAFILVLAYGKWGDPKGYLQTKWHAPILAAFGLAFLVGILAQRSRFCTAGGFRDVMLAGDFRLPLGYVVLLITILAGNLAIDFVWPGPAKQFNWGATPLAHSVHLWNFLGMFLVGFSANLLGGCPFRQLVAAGQGSSDAAMTVTGMIIGAAFCHNFGFAAKPATESS
jgi:YedE family putative selenium metabolism protein